MTMRKEDVCILKKFEPLWDDYTDIRDFEFLNDDDFENIVLPYLRKMIVPCEKRRLSYKILKSRGVVYRDADSSLDEYYVSMINDTLKCIRSGETAYLFSLEQVVEILRFEPNVNCVLCDGMYYLNMLPN